MKVKKRECHQNLLSFPSFELTTDNRNEIGLGRPVGIAICQENGDIFVSEHSEHVISRIDSNGTKTILAGSESIFPIQPFYFFLLSLSLQSQLFTFSFFYTSLLFTDTLLLNIQKTGLEGHVDGIGSEARFNGPFHLTFLNSTTLLCCDFGNSSIRSISIKGKKRRIVFVNICFLI